jgi:hypothetical protein
MKSRTVALLLLVLSWPTAARADERSHDRKIAGIVLTAAGATLTVGGITMVSYFSLYPPFIDVHHGNGMCTTDCSGPPPNAPLIAGATLLGVGAAALGTGIALLVVVKRR